MAATIKDIAKQTGLGLATISKYINGGNVREQNKLLIDKAIQDLNFTVNEFARGLKSNKSKTIGVLIPELTEIFCAQIIGVFEEILRQSGYSIIICDCHTDEKLECELVEFLLNKRVDGIITSPVNPSGKHLLPAIERGIPVVVFDRFSQPLMGKVDFVLVDNARASAQAIDFLVRKGHEKIGIIAGPTTTYTAGERLRGYKQALKSHKLKPVPDYIFSGDYTIEGGFRSMTEILESDTDITAIYVTNYFMTLGAIMAMNEYQGDKQLSFIGFDNIELTRLLKPVPTMVTQPMEEIGEKIAAIILKRLREEEKDPATSVVTLSTSIIEGESVHARTCCK